ncbi:MAG TPA: hypothetical protein VII66_10850 [Gemmatimonadaceae bacterium]
MANALDDKGENQEAARRGLRTPMATAMKIAQALIGLAGLALIGLGFAFWSGSALGFVPLHEQLGIFIVLALWVLAGIGVVYGLNRVRLAVAVLWGFIVIGFGFAQTGMMVGDMHWVIRILHLLVGLAALALASILAKEIAVKSGTRR